MHEDPSVVIIVVNWNGGNDTLLCLKSLSALDYPSYKVLVVDNNSIDGSPVLIRRQFPQVTLIENNANLGFTGANNVGIGRALNEGADYVLLLNNDTEVAPDFLRLLVETTESDSKIGIAGPLIYYYEQPRLVWSAGGRLDGCGRSSMIGLDEIDTRQFGENCREVDFVTGCALLARTSVLRRVGVLDDRFFAYYEETEWCVRARRAGFTVVNVPKAKIWHKIPLDKRDSSPLVHYYMTRNRVLFLKTTGAGPTALLRTIFGDYLRTLLAWSMRARWRGKSLHRKMMVRAIIDAGLGRWGPCRIDAAN